LSKQLLCPAAEVYGGVVNSTQRWGLGEVPDVRGSSAWLKICRPIEKQKTSSCTSAGICAKPM